MEQSPARTHVQPCTGPYGPAGVDTEVREQWNVLLVPLRKGTPELQHTGLALGSPDVSFQQYEAQKQGRKLINEAMLMLRLF